VAELIQTMKREGVKVIIKEPYFSDAVPNSIAKQTGATVVQLSPSVGGEKGTDDYIALIEHNVNKLVAALQRAT
jgi:ABC-type Zn uptake system ZnuABC Zn-binding protein ZnuA